MPAQMKRPAAAAVSPKAKRQSTGRQDPLTKKCSAIVETLESAEGYPTEVLEMLASCAKACLGMDKEDRHQVQNDVIDMLTEVLGSVEAARAQKVAELESKLADMDTEKASREAAVTAAAAARSEKKDVAVAASETASTAGTETTAAQVELDNATKEQKVGDADLIKAEEKKAAAEEMMNTELGGLKAGTAADAKKALKAVSKVAKDLGVEAQLLVSLAPAIGKAVAERTSFDSMVIGQLDEQLNNAVAKLTEQVTTGAASRTERAAKVEACKAKLQAAEAHEKACGEAAGLAKEAAAEASSQEKAAQQSVKQFKPEMQAAKSALNVAEAPHDACKEVLVTFKELVEGAPEVPEEAAEEAAEEVGENAEGIADEAPADAAIEA